MRNSPILVAFLVSSTVVVSLWCSSLVAYNKNCLRFPIPQFRMTDFVGNTGFTQESCYVYSKRVFCESFEASPCYSTFTHGDPTTVCEAGGEVPKPCYDGRCFSDPGERKCKLVDEERFHNLCEKKGGTVPGNPECPTGQYRCELKTIKSWDEPGAPNATVKVKGDGSDDCPDSKKVQPPKASYCD